MRLFSCKARNIIPTITISMASLCYGVIDINASGIILDNTAFIQSIGGSKKDVFQDGIENSKGELYAVGYSSSSSDLGSSSFGSDDGIITKFNVDGTMSWTKRIGGSARDRINAIDKNSDDTMVVVGRSKSNDNGFSNNGGYDAIIAKIDENGDIVWKSNIGGSLDEAFHDVTVTSDGGYLAVGKITSTDFSETMKGVSDVLVTKFNSNGVEEWSKTFGGTDEDIAHSVVEVEDGYILVGESKSTDAGFVHNGWVDAIIIKINKSGDLQWIKNFGGNPFDSFRSVVKTDGGFVCSGETYSNGDGIDNNGPPGTRDAVIVKYDSEGNREWLKTFGGTGGEVFTGVINTHTGGYMAIGYSDSTDAGFTNKGAKDSILVQYDRDGTQLKVDGFGGTGDEEIDKATYTYDGSIIFFGESSSADLGFEAKGDRDAVAFKYNLSIEEAVRAVVQAEGTRQVPDISTARQKVGILPESIHKVKLNERIDAIVPVGDGGLIPQSATANIDVYIKSENSLSVSLSTNSVTFEDFGGTEDLEKTNAIRLTVDSSLPYEVSASLPTEIQNSKKDKTMDKSILNIKANSELDYKTFPDINTKVSLLDSQIAGNDKIHDIDLKLKGGIAHEKDNYKTTIKFEVAQK